MASIVKRKNKYAVVYTYEDENGVKRQRWESYNTNAEAKKRKAQVEYELASNTFIPPSAATVRDLLSEYVAIYGVNTWAISTYDTRLGLIQNYINPMIGDVKLSDVSPHMMDKFYQDLLRVKAKVGPYKKDKNEYLSARTVTEIHKLLRCAFNQGVKWEMLPKNPVLNCTLPKPEEKRRDMWDAETLFKALQLCDDDILALALNLAFSCSLRMGEMLGLTWDCIDVSEESISQNKAYIYVNKELQRTSKSAVEKLNGRDVIFTFPPVMARNSTYLLLKTPKTKTSIRRVYLPKTVAEMLVERRKEIEEMKELFGEEYVDYNLVFCNPMGRPIEGQVITRLLNKLIRENDLPKVVFHSIRHTSTTYKLKISGGDIKAVQGDTGHAQASMVTERYAHILDDDRRINAERFEREFYGGDHTKESSAAKKENTSETPTSDAQMLLQMLEANPQMAELIKTLAKSL